MPKIKRSWRPKQLVALVERVGTSKRGGKVYLQNGMWEAEAWALGIKSSTVHEYKYLAKREVERFLRVTL